MHPRIAAVGPRIAERPDHVQNSHRRRIPVTDQQGQRIGGRAGVQVVDLLPVDLGDELRNLVESGFLCPPVEVLPPVSVSSWR